MQNKRLIVILGILVLIVGAAAFIGGRFLNHGLGSAGSIAVTIVPAMELPITSPEVTGPFIERRDNAMIVESKSLQAGGGGAPPAPGARREAVPLVEVLVTSQTVIYRETTHLSEPLSEETKTIQQTVVETTLDDLNTESMIMVWGRRSGDRIIAEVLMYSQTVIIKRAIFEDCETCP